LSRRKLGLNDRWKYVVSSLTKIVESYERASSAISLLSDRRLRQILSSYVLEKELVLDLGSGPGTLSRILKQRGADVVMLDYSRRMLHKINFEERVQGTFEYMPFRNEVFDKILSAFAFRDSYDTVKTINEITRILRKGGSFCFCDLGKPDSFISFILVSFYIRVFPSIIGAIFHGVNGLNYGSLFTTYKLLPKNSLMKKILERFFSNVRMSEMMLGGAVIFVCS